MNSVPGVMQLLSNMADGSTSSPRLRNSSRFSRASLADLNRRCRCWFILARGATPSIAMYSSFLGRAMLNSFSRYLKMPVNICSSERAFEDSPSVGASLCVHWERAGRERESRGEGRR